MLDGEAVLRRRLELGLPLDPVIDLRKTTASVILAVPFKLLT
jgi:hypothetical protein